MITQKIIKIIRKLTRIVNQFNILLKSFEKLFKGVFYILSLIYIAKGTLSQTFVATKKTLVVNKFDEQVPEGMLMNKMELIKKPYFHMHSAYEYGMFIIGVFLMIILLYKLIKLFKKH